MKLFKKLAAIYSPSHNEEPMRQYIRRWCQSVVPDAIIDEDEEGNLYITRGKSDTYPCVVAHLDQVQSAYPKDYKVIESEHIICAYSPSQRKHCGLGADDKCGIWIALKMLKKHSIMKVAFFPGEECGCIGSSEANMDFFKDVRFVIQPDRRGANDIITQIGMTDLCSDEFLEVSGYEKFGFKEANGMMTDVETLKHRGLSVSCINISCGYYKPHTEEEYVYKPDLINTCNFVDHVISTMTEVYPHEYTPSVSTNRGWSRYGHNSKYLDDWYSGFYASKYYRTEHKTEQLSGVGANQSASTTAVSEVELEDVEENDDDLKFHGETYNAEDLTEEEWDAYVEQYNDALDFVTAELSEDPKLNAKTFYDTYGHELYMLSLDDIQSVFDEVKNTL